MVGNSGVEKVSEGISRERKIIVEMGSMLKYLKNAESEQERNMANSQLKALTENLKKTGKEVIENVGWISLAKPLDPNKVKKPVEENKQQPQTQIQLTQNQVKTQFQQPQTQPLVKAKKLKAGPLEKLSLKRMLKHEEKEEKKKTKKPSVFVNTASKLFYNTSMNLIKEGKLKQLRRDLVKSNIQIVPASYISVIFFSALIGFIASIFVTLFFLFFNVGATPPFITTVEESLGLRFLKVFWLLFFIPLGTGFFAYFYPSLEKKSLEGKIDRELPFAVIHMSSISSSMIEPSKVFDIIISTKEYPNLEKEFIMLQNEINIYGYDLVNALKSRTYNTPSRKLSELFNGLSTTITSGGNLPEFFEKRSQTLLFEHRLEKEREGKAAETFMDIYISVVIAAPMILMLLLIMMRLSGLGISLSTGMITLIMVIGVTFINIIFLSFLQVKQPGGG